MLEFGARFSDNFYVKVGIDPDDGSNNFVVVETIAEGETVVLTGTITWDEDDDGLG